METFGLCFSVYWAKERTVNFNLDWENWQAIQKVFLVSILSLEYLKPSPHHQFCISFLIKHWLFWHYSRNHGQLLGFIFIAYAVRKGVISHDKWTSQCNTNRHVNDTWHSAWYPSRPLAQPLLSSSSREGASRKPRSKILDCWMRKLMTDSPSEKTLFSSFLPCTSLHC